MTSFHETVPAPPGAEKRARTQEELILRLFRNLPSGKCLSPESVHRMAFKSTTPITSVRRAMTNLTDAGLLVKTGQTIQGSYGVRVHLWKLAPEPRQQSLFELTSGRQAA